MVPGYHREYYPDLARISKVLTLTEYLRIRLIGHLVSLAALQLRAL